MQQPAVAILLAFSTGALGLFAGATLLGKSTPRRADAPTGTPVDFTPLIASMDALRESIDVGLNRRNHDLAEPAPRTRIPGATPTATGDDSALTHAIGDLQVAILGLRMQSAGERAPRAGIVQADRMTDARKPMDVVALEAFLERYPELLESKLPVELTFYGLADYVELFGTPSEHGAGNDGTHYLWYRIDPGEPNDGRRINVHCTRDATSYIGYDE